MGLSSTEDPGDKAGKEPSAAQAGSDRKDELSSRTGAKFGVRKAVQEVSAKALRTIRSAKELGSLFGVVPTTVTAEANSRYYTVCGGHTPGIQTQRRPRLYFSHHYFKKYFI